MQIHFLFFSSQGTFTQDVIPWTTHAKLKVIYKEQLYLYSATPPITLFFGLGAIYSVIRKTMLKED